MKSFITYDTSEENLKSEQRLIPEICKRYICNSQKKCQNFYKQNKDDKSKHNKLIKCPYGFYCYFGDNHIYTCLISMDDDNSSLRRKFNYQKEKLKDQYIYSKEELLDFIEDYETMQSEISELRNCTHDLRNIGTYFNSMSNTLSNKFPELFNNDFDFKAMLCLYDMMNYRLSYTNDIVESDYKFKKMKLHPILEKLRIMMSYKAKNKNIQLRLGENNDFITGFDNLYLAFFIIIENAIKHSPPSKEIEIYFENLEGVVMVGVSNFSAKVEDDEFDKIILRGYRGKNVTCVGNGIGLSVFSDICKKQGLKYRFESKRINKNEYLFITKIFLPIANESV